MLHGNLSNRVAPSLYIDLGDLLVLKEGNMLDKVKRYIKKETKYKVDTSKLAFVLQVLRNTDMNVLFVVFDKELYTYMVNRKNYDKVFGHIKMPVTVRYMTKEMLSDTLKSRAGYFVSDADVDLLDNSLIYSYDEIRKLIFS